MKENANELGSGPSFQWISADHDVLPSDPRMCVCKRSQRGIALELSVLGHTTGHILAGAQFSPKYPIFMLLHCPAYVQEKASLGPVATECALYVS